MSPSEQTPPWRYDPKLLHGKRHSGKLREHLCASLKASSDTYTAFYAEYLEISDGMHSM